MSPSSTSLQSKHFVGIRTKTIFCIFFCHQNRLTNLLKFIACIASYEQSYHNHTNTKCHRLSWRKCVQSHIFVTTSNISLSFIAFITLLHYYLSCVACQELTEYHDTILDILTRGNYSSATVPPDPPLKLFVNSGLREIEDVDDKKMELKVQLSLRMKWLDKRLAYSSAGKSGYVTIQQSRPWTPDIFINREKQSTLHTITKPNQYIRIYPNGTVMQSMRFSATISCFMKLQMFPFDKQTCEIRLMSYAYPITTMHLAWDPFSKGGLEPVGTDKISSDHLTQFRLVGQRVGSCLSLSTAGNYSAVFVQLHFQRQVTYYLMQMYLPSTMLVILSWVAFWLGEAIEARLSLTVTALLTLSTQITGAIQSTPMVSYVTALATFTATCLMFGALAILETALVFSLTLRKEKVEHRGDKEAVHVDVIEQDEGNLKNIMESTLRNRKVMPKQLEHFLTTEMTTWRRRMILHPKAAQIDEVSKILFPALFGLFAVVYFGMCLRWTDSSNPWDPRESSLDKLCDHRWEF